MKFNNDINFSFISTFFWFVDFCDDIDVVNTVESWDESGDVSSSSVGDGRKPQAPRNNWKNEWNHFCWIYNNYLMD